MIKYIKIKNMISNNKEVIINFDSKYNKDYEDIFFNYSIKKKNNRIKNSNATLKIMGIIGRNSAYKTSTLSSIDKILSFILNFKKNLIYYAFKKIDIRKAFEWYHQTTKKNPINLEIDKMLEKYWKHINKNKNIPNMEEKYIKDFYKKNCFNKNEKISFEIQFNKKNLNFKVNMNNQNNNFFYNIMLNDKKYDVLNSKKLDWFNYDFFSLTLLNKNSFSFGKDIEFYLDLALEYLYNQKFKKKKEKLLLFLQKLDSSIIDIKIKIKNDSFRILKITREYDDIVEDMAIKNLSTGTKIFIIYLHNILKNDFIIFDEIENSLHLKLIELLFDIAKQNNKQVIFSTHSPFVVNNLLNKFQLYIYEITNDKLTINLANKLFREKESISKKYLSDLVSQPNDSDLDFIRMELY